MGVIDFAAKQIPGIARTGENLFNSAANLAGGVIRASGPLGAAGAGLAVGTAVGIGGAALGAAYLGYRALRGPNKNLHTDLGKNKYQLNPWAQGALMLPAGPIAASQGILGASRKPWVSDMSPNGNLEAKTPAQFNATGDIVLSQHKRF